VATPAALVLVGLGALIVPHEPAGEAEVPSRTGSPFTGVPLWVTVTVMVEVEVAFAESVAGLAVTVSGEVAVDGAKYPKASTTMFAELVAVRTSTTPPVPVAAYEALPTMFEVSPQRFRRDSLQHRAAGLGGCG